MKKYLRSICSTCSYVQNCSLTTNKSSIYECNEYVHHLDADYIPSVMNLIKTTKVDFEKVEKRELILN